MTFRYTNLCAFAAKGAEPQVRKSVNITNTGARDGEEVVQFYANEPEAWTVRGCTRCAA